VQARAARTRNWRSISSRLPPSRRGLLQVMGAVALFWRSHEPPSCATVDVLHRCFGAIAPGVARKAIVPQSRCEPTKHNGQFEVGRLSMDPCVHFNRSLPSNSWWQTMVGCQVLYRTGRFPASGFPTGFIVGHTSAAQGARVSGAALRVRRRRGRRRTYECPVLASCAVWRGSVGRDHRHAPRSTAGNSSARCLKTGPQYSGGHT
jgi:hypothetical protein